MLDSLRLYPKFVAIAIRSRMQYRSDFLVGLFGVLILNLVNLALIYVMINRFQALAGWGFWEIVMLYAMWLTSHSVYAVLFWHLSDLEEDILHGRMDQFLVRPCSTLVQFLGKEVNYFGVADVMFAATAFSLAYTNLELHWSPLQWAYYAVALLAGLAIETSIAWMIGSIAFWTGRSWAIYRIQMNFALLSQQYPIDIFGLWYRIFVTGFLPIAFINYFPLTILLDKPSALEVPWLGFLSPLVAVVLVLAAWTVWKRGLAGYTSSGN